MKKNILCLLFLAAIFTLSACGTGNKAPVPGTEQNPGASPIIYQNEQMGFSLEFPTSWEGKYSVETEVYISAADWSVEIFHTATREEMGAGWLFNIACTPGEDYTEDQPPVMAGWCPILAQTGGCTYYAFTPSGVEYDEDPASAAGKEYRELYDQIDIVISSFKLLD
ncbi:MAG: hypothetical protein FWG06_00885 [Clostridiales bacterium]|nr:hypothetical protein [Clostridiales bacterium]